MDKMERRLTLDKLRRTDPESFAEMAENAGHYAEAYRYYSRQKGEEDLFHAAELAMKMKRYSLVRPLLAKARVASDRSLGISEAGARGPFPEGSGMMGAAMSYWSAEEGNKKMKEKISVLEGKLAQLGK